MKKKRILRVTQGNVQYCGQTFVCIIGQCLQTSTAYGILWLEKWWFRLTDKFIEEQEKGGIYSCAKKEFLWKDKEFFFLSIRNHRTEDGASQAAAAAAAAAARPIIFRPFSFCRQGEKQSALKKQASSLSCKLPVFFSCCHLSLSTPAYLRLTWLPLRRGSSRPKAILHTQTHTFTRLRLQNRIYYIVKLKQQPWIEWGTSVRYCQK